MTIRRFRDSDAPAVSELIVENLKTVNIRDYSEELVDALAACRTPQQLLESVEKCDAFVATENGRISGVAMLNGDRMTNVFVHAQMHGRGIGSSLVSRIERLAKKRRIPRLVVDSSITAAGFYTKCGYRTIRKVNKPFRGIENIVFEMIKTDL